MKIPKVLLLIFTALMLCNYILIEKGIKIFLAGDSTIAHKLPEKKPETGWGEKIGFFFNESIVIENHAKNGRSTKTFISQGRWQKIIDSVSPGDYIFVQFGHNDQSKHKADRYTPPEDFTRNLIRFVNDARSKNAIPVLFTPVMRRRFDDDGNFYDVHGEYPDLVRNVAKELNVDLIDLHKRSEALFIELGKEETKKLFLILKPDEYPNYPDGKNDNTHFSEYGAKVIAQLVANAIQQSNIKLKDLLIN